MRILVAYDGTSGSDDALADLDRAGLPEHADVRILSAVPDATCCPDEASSAAGFGARRRRDPGRLSLDHARALAGRAEAQLRVRFPHWSIRHDALPGCAADVLLDAAADGEAEFLVAGSHAQRRGAEVPPLGSIARRLVAEAPCTVRVGRRGPDGRRSADVRLLVGYDASPGADGAIDAICRRTWRGGTSARVVVVVDPHLASSGPADGAGVPWKWLRERSAAACAALRAAGIGVSSDILTGDPRTVLVAEAVRTEADAIFVGALGGAGAAGTAPKLVGSAATAVAATAPCSVEVVRPRRGEPAGTAPSPGTL